MIIYDYSWLFLVIYNHIPLALECHDVDFFCVLRSINESMELVVLNYTCFHFSLQTRVMLMIGGDDNAAVDDDDDDDEADDNTVGVTSLW